MAWGRRVSTNSPRVTRTRATSDRAGSAELLATHEVNDLATGQAVDARRHVVQGLLDCCQDRVGDKAGASDRSETADARLDVRDASGLDCELGHTQVAQTVGRGSVRLAFEADDQVGGERDKDLEVGLEPTPHGR